MTYKFNQFNVEIVDPTVEILPDIVNYNYVSKIGSVNIKLTDSSGSTFGVLLEELNIPTLNAGTITAKVNLKLTEFEV